MKKVGLAILVIFILIQFIRPDRNDSGDWTNDYTTVLDVPVEVVEIIKTSCGDCHSNRTKYPWYGNIAPASWYLDNHVRHGKGHLNFSEWTDYNENQLNHILNDLEEVLETKEMPLKSYLWLHEEAKMSQEQYDVLKKWVATLKTN